MSRDFGVALELETRRTVLRVRGDLDLLTAPGLEAVLDAVLRGGDVDVVMDVADVRFVDATFLNVVARAARTLQSSGRTLTLRSPDGFQRRLLNITGLDELLSVEVPPEGPPVAATLAGAATAPAARAVLDASLRLVAHLAQATVDGADGASVTLARHGRLRTVAATDQVVSGMDEDQYATGQGPCVESAQRRLGVYVPVVAEEVRWPRFIPRARERGIHSILSTPLGPSDGPVGALNIYSFTDHAFAGGEQELAAVFAARASDLLADAQLEGSDDQLASRLRQALRVRETVALAQGILMARTPTSAEDAYSRLVEDSRRTGRPLRDLAADAVSSVATEGGEGASGGAQGRGEG